MGGRARPPKRLLVLGAGPAQLGLLRAARDRGLYVVACDRESGAPGFRFADRRAVVSTEDELGIERLARAERIDGLVAPGIDWPVAIAARVADRLGLAHPLDPATAAIAVSKLRQRECFAAAGVAQPRWQLLGREETATEIATPCAVKPPDRQGQRGLSLVEDASELEVAIARAAEASRRGSVLVEELADGPEVTVNAFSTRGAFHPLTVTDRLRAATPAFGVALAHAWPSSIADDAVVAAARGAAAAVGVHAGPTYTQVRITADGPKVMELAARLGGGHDAELCRVALGIDLNDLALAAALGEDVEVPPARPVGGACVRFLVPPEGELEETTGLADALAVEGVVDAAVYRGPGHVFGPFRAGADRAGYVIARGDSRDDALDRALRAGERIRFVTVDAAARVQT